MKTLEMIKTVQTTGAPIKLTFTEAEFEEHFAHVARMEAGHSATGHHEWLAQVLATRGLPALPPDFCWSLTGLSFSIWEVSPARLPH
jgi:hypothetical protein